MEHLNLLLPQMAEYRISIYGRKMSEWDQMASWIVNNELYSENVVWLIQVLTQLCHSGNRSFYILYLFVLVLFSISSLFLFAIGGLWGCHLPLRVLCALAWKSCLPVTTNNLLYEKLLPENSWP